MNEVTLEEALDRHASRYPGDSADRQPAHVVYGGADIFRRDTAARLGRLAIASMDEWATTPAELFDAVAPGVSTELATEVYARVRAKLEREPVEDFRIDFEDGFGIRGDDEEDGEAGRAADETAAGLAAESLSPFIGIRIKPLSREFTRRGLRTLELYLARLLSQTGGRLPNGFVVTLPKVVAPEQVRALVRALEDIETVNALFPGALRFEIMVETPQALIAADGSCPLPRFIEAGDGRCTAAHLGIYDFTASTGITADHQIMQHPMCDIARQIMRLALSETGVMLSDGATNLLPVVQHRQVAGGPPLSPAQESENLDSIRGAWRLHYDDVRHSLINGFYQGWDLHPAQLVTRYAALYAFFLEGFDSAADRLRRFVDRAARATLTGDVFDDAATGQGLLNFFLRGLACGALTEDEVLTTGLTLAEFRSRSFAAILAGRSTSS